MVFVIRKFFLAQYRNCLSFFMISILKLLKTFLRKFSQKQEAKLFGTKVLHRQKSTTEI